MKDGDYVEFIRDVVMGDGSWAIPAGTRGTACGNAHGFGVMLESGGYVYADPKHLRIVEPSPDLIVQADTGK